MQSTFKLKFFCLLWLTLLQVQAQDIEPDFPNEFDTTKIATAGPTSGPATEQHAPTTTSEPALEPYTEGISPRTTTTMATTTEAEATTGLPLTTTPATTTTEAVPSTTPRLLRPNYPPRRIPTRPYFPYRRIYSLLLEELGCYLLERDEHRRLPWSRGLTSKLNRKSCYRCCPHSHSEFSGCHKLYSGRCRYSGHSSEEYDWETWDIDSIYH